MGCPLSCADYAGRRFGTEDGKATGLASAPFARQVRTR
jgi:hypothetical protein